MESGEEYQRELVYGEEYKDVIDEAYKHRHGIEYGADNAAHTIGILE